MIKVWQVSNCNWQVTVTYLDIVKLQHRNLSFRITSGSHQTANIRCPPKKNIVSAWCRSAKKTSRLSWNRFPSSTPWYSSKRCWRITRFKIHFCRLSAIPVLPKALRRESRDSNDSRAVDQTLRPETIRISRRAALLSPRPTWMNSNHLLIKWRKTTRKPFRSLLCQYTLSWPFLNFSFLS